MTPTVTTLLACGLNLLAALGIEETPERRELILSVPDPRILTIIAVESRFDEKAESPKGAKGLLQITPIAVKAAQEFCPDIPEDAVDRLFEPEINIRVGSCFFYKLLTRYDDNLKYTLLHYNCGGDCVDAIRRFRPINTETANYYLTFTELYDTVCLNRNYLRRTSK